MAYHLSPLFPSAPPCGSRLTTSPSRTGIDRPGLMECFHQLAFERSLRVDDAGFRVGLAATPRHLQQSQDLLARRDCAPTKTPVSERAVVLALSNTLHEPSQDCALGTIWLQRAPTDDAALAQLDAGMARALADLQAQAKRPAIIEGIALKHAMPNLAVVEAMLWSAREIAVEIWQSTHILALCPVADEDHYCNRHGFSCLVPGSATTPSLLQLRTQYATSAAMAMNSKEFTSIQVETKAKSSTSGLWRN